MLRWLRTVPVLTTFSVQPILKRPRRQPPKQVTIAEQPQVWNVERIDYTDDDLCVAADDRLFSCQGLYQLLGSDDEFMASLGAGDDETEGDAAEDAEAEDAETENAETESDKIEGLENGDSCDPRFDSFDPSFDSFDSNFDSCDPSISFPMDDSAAQMRLLGLPTSFAGREEPAEPRAKRKKAARRLCENVSAIYDAKDIAYTPVAVGGTGPAPGREWGAEEVLAKYFRQRHSLWSRYDAGIQMDTVGWYSVTPEAIAQHIGSRCPAGGRPLLVWDPFGGLGGNAIQFAAQGHHVVCSDISAERLAMAEHNARIYGVAEYIDFVQGDFFALAQGGTLRPDVVFLSPPWGGPSYLAQDEFDVCTMMDLDGRRIFDAAKAVAPNTIYFLPKNSSVASIAALVQAQEQTCFEVEENWLEGRLKSLCVYHGPLFV